MISGLPLSQNTSRETIVSPSAFSQTNGDAPASSSVRTQDTVQLSEEGRQLALASAASNASDASLPAAHSADQPANGNPATQAIKAYETNGGAGNIPTSYAIYFMPVRAGYTGIAFAAAINDPAAQSSSAGKTMSETAKAARAGMDAKYAAMQAAGAPFDNQSPEGRDWNSLMGDLDRRSLLAIRDNVGALFSKEERSNASDLMLRQQGLAMGLYSGPISQQDNFADRFGQDNAARLKAAAAWLDRVSADERQTAGWMSARMDVNSALASIGKYKPPKKPKTLLDYIVESEERGRKLRKHTRERRKTLAARDGNSLVEQILPVMERGTALPPLAASSAIFPAEKSKAVAATTVPPPPAMRNVGQPHPKTPEETEAESTAPAGSAASAIASLPPD